MFKHKFRVAYGWIILIVLFSVPVAFIAHRTSAQDNQTDTITLNVTPTTIELDGNPGEPLQGSFKVVSGSDVPLLVRVIPKNFTASGEEGAVDLTEDDTSYSLAKWIVTEPSTVEIPARGSQIFEYVINVPDNAEPGGHFGSIIVQTEPVRIDEAGPAVSQEIGPLVLVKIAGDSFEEASIVEFTTADSFLEKGPVTFVTRVQNNGNVHFKPQGRIEIKNMFGSVVTTLDLEEKNVLPDAIRKLTNDWNPDGFALGRYTADLTLTYGIDNTIVTASTSFTIFPYKTVVPIAIVVIVLIIPAIKNRRRIKKALVVLKEG